MSLLVNRPKGKMANYKKKPTYQGLYNKVMITKSIPLNISNVGNNIKETLEKAVAFQIEGKCIVEGYIKPKSIEVITFSSGLIMGSNVIFEVVIQCDVCSPVEGMHINCIAKHINKAGIRAEVNEMPSPVVIFIARDHNYMSPLFSEVKENEEIKVRVIGQRFELNDTYISIIAELVDNNNTYRQPLEPKAASRNIVKPTITITAPAAEPPTITASASEPPTITASVAEPITTTIAKTIIKKKITVKKPKITFKE